MENEASSVTEAKPMVAPLEKPKTVPSDVAPVSSTPVRTSKKMQFQMNRTRALLLLLLIVLLAVAYHWRGLFIAATVNGNPVSRLAVIQDLEKRSGQQALDTLITKKLIQDEASHQKIVVPQADIDNEIKNIESQVTGQGMTLEQALNQQHLTEAELREQIMLQKELEKILGDKGAVGDDEVTSYIAENKLTVPKGTTSEAFASQVKDKLKGQKFSTEATTWIADAKAKAKIEYFVDYGMPTPVPTASSTTPAQ